MVREFLMACACLILAFGIGVLIGLTALWSSHLLS